MCVCVHTQSHTVTHSHTHSQVGSSEVCLFSCGIKQGSRPGPALPRPTNPAVSSRYRLHLVRLSGPIQHRVQPTEGSGQRRKVKESSGT